MKNIDWHYLKKSILFFAISAIIAVSAGLSAYFFQVAQVENYEKSMATLRSTHNLYRNMVNDLDLLEQYRALYESYRDSGLVGGERRLSWIESLQGTNQILRLPTLTYSLLPQEEFNRPGFKIKRSVEVKSSPMQLSMGLLHEEDLLAVLEGLRQSIKNLFTVDSCSITRISGLESSLNTKAANFQSRCQIRWVTIDAK